MTSNRDPAEWLAAMADPLLAQSAVDRLQSTGYELVVEGESYRRRLKPGRAGQATDPAGRVETGSALDPGERRWS